MTNQAVYWDSFSKLLQVMESALRDFETGMRKPVPIQSGRHKILRIDQQDVYHAMFLKLVMIVSGLNAAFLLLRNGYVFEQGSIQRMVHEASEDVLFLSLGAINGLTGRHERYLAAFWAEEHADVGKPVDTHQSREMVPRDKISAYITNTMKGSDDPSTSNKVMRVLNKVYSGFVHGAAPHLMELYDPDSKQFRVQGMGGTIKMDDFTYDLWNYMFRGFQSFMFAAKAFGSQEMFDTLAAHLKAFQAATGRES